MPCAGEERLVGFGPHPDPEVPRELYQRIIADLWGGGLREGTGAKYLAELERLPEFDFDDSHFRDFYVAMALELVHLAIQIVLAATVGTEAGRPWLGLNNLFDDLCAEFDLDDLPDDLRNAASAIDAGGPDPASNFRKLATQTAERVNAALAATAISLGWTVERVHGAP